MLKGTFLSGERLQGSRWKQEVIYLGGLGPSPGPAHQCFLLNLSSQTPLLGKSHPHMYCSKKQFIILSPAKSPVTRQGGRACLPVHTPTASADESLRSQEGMLSGLGGWGLSYHSARLQSWVGGG